MPVSNSASLFRRVLGLLLVAALGAAPALASPSDTPQVLASIKPLALIARAVVGDQGQVAQLLPDNASPHDYPLRVSEVRRLQAADLVLWVGPELETFLQRPLRNLPAERQLEAQQLPGMSWPAATHSHSGHAHVGHLHERDPHLWLNPRNGALIAQALAETLAQHYPAQADDYRANAAALSERLAVLDQALEVRLQPLAGRGFAVYHEGYAHFVERYGLLQLAHVTFSPERRPGARHMQQLRTQLRAQGQCLFTEPYYDMRMAEDLARELSLRVGVLDPLGGESVTSYPELLEKLADALEACLAPSASASAQ